MKKVAAVLALLFAPFFFGSFAYADHVNAPNVPTKNIEVRPNQERIEQCGTLIFKRLYDAIKNEAWTVLTWKGDTHPFTVLRDYNAGNSSETWVDYDSDGHFDEHLNDHESRGKFLAKYPKPCDAVMK